MENSDILLRDYARALWNEKAIRIEDKPFALKSGGESHIYLEHRGFISKYSNLRLVAHLLEATISCVLDNYTLCSVDSIASPVIVGSIASFYNHDMIFPYNSIANHGLKKSIFGEPTYPLILIDDVTSTGSTLINASKLLLENRIDANTAAVIAIRNKDLVIDLEHLGIRLLSCCLYSDLVKILWGELTPNQQRFAEKELSI